MVYRMGRFSKHQPNMKPLEIENETYREHLESLLVDEGKFVVISGKDVLGTFSAYDDALKVGYERCGLTPFLVKQILEIEPMNFISRNIGSLCLT